VVWVEAPSYDVRHTEFWNEKLARDFYDAKSGQAARMISHRGRTVEQDVAGNKDVKRFMHPF